MSILRFSHSSIHLKRNASLHRSIRPFIQPSNHPSNVYLPIHPFIHPSVQTAVIPYVNLFIHPPVRPSINPFFSHLHTQRHIRPSSKQRWLVSVQLWHHCRLEPSRRTIGGKRAACIHQDGDYANSQCMYMSVCVLVSAWRCCTGADAIGKKSPTYANKLHNPNHIAKRE
ncbi:unnamed protein product [Protopolystoma xenopodis]|uniref:Uncharacterized protein n=1 Tax=Protopolystoma xenopodis TaxID=117903 RepID=A0A3S4ZQQ1_9PLAT|nr:unnamed protein product [Protopolystoma xenopodis]